MNGSLKKIISLLTLLPLSGGAGCSPTENMEPIERDAKLVFRDGPAPIPIPPIDPDPLPSEKKIITIPEITAAPPSAIDKSITTPAGALYFGLQKIDGSSLLAGSACPGGLQSDPNPKGRILCIKIPDTPTDRMWWHDQYIKQLVSLGWTMRESIQKRPTYFTELSGKRESGCQSRMAVILLHDGLYDGINRDSKNKNNNFPLPDVKGTYLVLIDDMRSKCSK